MLIETETVCLNSRMLLYVIADEAANIGEVGLHTYGESPVMKVQTSPATAKKIMEAWIQGEKEEEDGYAKRRRVSLRRPRRSVKKGAKK